MKFETTPAFDQDVRRLKREHLQQFLDVLKTKFIPDCDAYAADPTTAWPQSLRVKSVQGAPGILEMTWFFASRDGRATFELVTVDTDLRLRWRRVGDHDVSRRRWGLSAPAQDGEMQLTRSSRSSRLRRSIDGCKDSETAPA